ncbi:MAG: cation-translocating P-type ATPase [Bacteroidia bacterium]|nr:cation-translocating P-type ATPase [Chitinophagales bacterium]MBX7239631.1 cation-translocating P-type ATPase [Bacteroidia bacterium]HNF32086.1 cation-translocating P-type ATPase [Bacteroidia bacterium]HNJ89798.1 cation-translocating P-type ATPase [Chitinophagales bacterium]HNN11661.1 cation-translocating P-type ATPase [Bacteroidia bacterium]
MKLPFKDRKFILLLAGVIVVIILEILSLSGIHIPMPYAPFIFAIFVLGIGYNVLWNGIKSLLKLNFGSINLLMLIAVAGAFYLGEYPEAAVVIVLYVLGERLEDIGIENSKTALDELVSKSPKTATVKLTGDQLLIDRITIGTIIQVKPGELIPMDGKITEGETTIDEASITGEPIPKDKHKGDIVFAGTLNKHGFIEIETTKLSADTTFSKIVKLTFEGQANKSDTQKFIQKFSKKYTPAIILLSVLVFVIPVVFNHQPIDKWLNQAITLLVIACPCALVISTPVAIYAAIGNASGKGALIKGGKYVEALAKVKAIALDKTRTITFGKPIVSDVIPLNGTDKEELLACAAGAEVFSEHPLAEAIIEATRKEGFEPHAVEKFKSIAGKGAIAKCLVCEDETIFIGKLSFIEEHQPVSEEARKIVTQLVALGKTSVVVSFGDGVAGIIGLMDEIKPDSAEALKEIEELNLEPVMLTGDHEQAAKYISEQVGIKKFYGNLLPENKSDKIKELLNEYKYVAMVGDGVNDAPALALSTVGIAMGAAGSDTAIETANIALMNDKLSLIPFLIRLSKRTLRQIKINTIGAILIKLIFIILAFAGYSNLVLAIAADVGVTLIVILISLRLMKFK